MNLGRYSPSLSLLGGELSALVGLSKNIKSAISPIISLRKLRGEDADGKSDSLPIRTGSDVHAAFHKAMGGELSGHLSLDKVLTLWPAGTSIFISIEPDARDISPVQFLSAIQKLSRQYPCHLIPVFPIEQVDSLLEALADTPAEPIATSCSYKILREFASNPSNENINSLKQLSSNFPNLITIIDFSSTCEAHLHDRDVTLARFTAFLHATKTRRIIVAGNSVIWQKPKSAHVAVRMPRHDKRLFDLLKENFGPRIIARSDATCLPPSRESKPIRIANFRAYIRGIQENFHILLPGHSADYAGRAKQYPSLIETYLNIVSSSALLVCGGHMAYLRKSINSAQSAIAAAMNIYMTFCAAEAHPLGLGRQPLAPQIIKPDGIKPADGREPELPF